MRNSFKICDFSWFCISFKHEINYSIKLLSYTICILLNKTEIIFINNFKFK